MSETLMSETLMSETLMSETLMSETLMSETLMSETLMSETLKPLLRKLKKCVLVYRERGRESECANLLHAEIVLRSVSTY
jgi:hypothetical protein